MRNTGVPAAIYLCMTLTALCFILGIGFVAAAFLVSPQMAALARPAVLQWFGLLLIAVGGGYVLIANATTRNMTPGEANAQAYAHCPPFVRLTSYALMILSAAAFFAAIAVVESGRVERSVGESAIIGSFAVLLSSAVFALLWSTLVRTSRDA